MRLSIVTTLYRSQAYIDEFYRRVRETALQITTDYEIVFVNDGSPDASLSKAKILADHDERVVVVDLTRNYGHFKAIMRGLEEASGDYIMLIDVDLEEEPEIIYDFWLRMHGQDQPDVVYATQQTRKGGRFEVLTGKAFWWLFNVLSDVKVQPSTVTARLFRRHFVDKLLQLNSHELFIASVIASVGCSQVGVVIKKLNHSPTTYSLSKKVTLFLNGVTASSSQPLLYIFYLSFFCLMIACVALLRMLYLYAVVATPVIGWTSLIASVWLLGAITLFSLGVCGLYIARIFNEVRPRPFTLTREVYKNGSTRNPRSRADLLSQNLG